MNMATQEHTLEKRMPKNVGRSEDERESIRWSMYTHTHTRDTVVGDRQ